MTEHEQGADADASGETAPTQTTPEETAPAQGPIASVVIPTKDRPEALRRCLDALSRSRLARHCFEVIVVDDGGRASLTGLDDEFGARLQMSLRRQPPSGPAVARNHGASAALGDLLVFTDDDCEPEPGWLPEMVARFRESPEAVLGGGIRNGRPGDPYCEASQALFDHLYRSFNGTTTRAAFFASCNLAVPRTLFLECGGFDANYPFAAGEDRALCSKLRARSIPLVYTADAIVKHHPHQLDLRGFWRQHFRYGRGARLYRRAGRARGGKERVGFETPGFYLGILVSPFRAHGTSKASRLSLLMALSQIATVAGYGYETLRPTPSRQPEPRDQADSNQ